MADLMSHPWVQGDTATLSEVKLEFKARKERFDQAL